MKQDPKTSDIDIWTYDLASGKEYAVTRDNWPENAPIWAPDGKRVMYASTRDSYSSIYRRNWDGTGEEEMLFRYTPGAGIVLTDSSPDGKFLVFFTGVLVMVPLTGSDPLARKSIDWLRDEYDNVGGKFSPDGRYIAYLANVEDAMALDVYVRPFDASKPDSPPPGEPVQVSKNAVASGMIAWRADGKELYFMTRDWEVMAVDVTTTPTFRAGTPKLLFKLPVQPVGNALQWKNVSGDGQRFVFSMPAR
jgi:Tol biopolymer transport system component